MELVTAGLFVVMLQKSMLLHQDIRLVVLDCITRCVFAAFLIVVFFIDLDFYIIPNKIVYLGLAIGMVLAATTAAIGSDFNLLLSRILGAAVGAGITLLIAFLGSIVFRKEAMGGGDVKLMAMIGIYLGLWPYIPLTIIVASFLGSFVGIGLILAKRKNMSSRVPFGPFLTIGAIISLLYGDSIWQWYHGLMGF